MTLVTVRDRDGVRWTNFKSLCSFIGAADNGANFSRDLYNYVLDNNNAQDYSDLDLTESEKIADGSGAFVDDTGVLDYCRHCENNASVDAILRLLRLTLPPKTANYDFINVSREPVLFFENKFMISDHLLVVRVNNKELWIECAKVCSYFDCDDEAVRLIQEHILPNNKRKMCDFTSEQHQNAKIPLVVHPIDDLSGFISGSKILTPLYQGLKNVNPDIVFVNETAIGVISRLLGKPIINCFWWHVNRWLAERYDFEFDQSLDNEEKSIVRDDDDDDDDDNNTNISGYSYFEKEKEDAEEEEVNLDEEEGESANTFWRSLRMTMRKGLQMLGLQWRCSSLKGANKLR